MEEQKPLEFTDFSGGITDNIIQGDIRRYAECDNIFITVDKKLEERPGIIPFSNNGYSVSGFLNQRFNGWYWLINETLPVVQAGRSLFSYDSIADTWSEIVGIGGNPAIQGGDNYSQTTFGEFKHQIFFATDGTDSVNGVQPSKIYRNTSNSWVAKTAGLPRSYVAPNYTNDILLSRCIALANSLRTSFINHMSDALNANYTGTPTFSLAPNAAYIHAQIDKYSLSYFATQTFAANAQEVPSPLPTPAPAATDQASLFTLVFALCNAYTHHITDASKGTLANNVTPLSRNYHWLVALNILDGTNTLLPNGPHAAISNNTQPTDLVTAATQLDDLTQKWNWHRKAIWLHSEFNTQTVFDKYAPTVSKIGTVTLAKTTPTVTPDLSDLYNFANNLKSLFNSHTSDPLSLGLISGHTLPAMGPVATYNNLTDFLSDSTTLDDTYLQIFWLRALYFVHWLDANVASHTTIQFTPTSGSANLATITRLSTGAAYTMPAGQVLYAYSNSTCFPPRGDAFHRQFAFAGGTGSGTAVLDCLALSSSVTQGQHSKSLYHVAKNAAGSYIDTTTSVQLATSQMGSNPLTLGTDPLSWLALATELWSCMASHVADSLVHPGPGTLVSYVQNIAYPNFMVPTLASYSYAYYFSDTYTVEPNGLQFETRGNPVQSDVVVGAISYYAGYNPSNDLTLNAALASSNISLPVLTTRANLLSNLPVLVNDASTNYDTANAKLNIYRTEDGGQTYRLLAQVPNGTLTYSDTTNDTIASPGSTALEDNESLYTTGGVVGYDQPPVCKFVHEVNGTFYYGAVYDDDQFFPQRILQSVPNIPDSGPATFSDDLEDELVGISSARSVVVAFCRSSIYRMSSSFNQQGQGSLLHDKIADKVGALNAKSIVQTEIGIFFAGTDGFYYTDGYQIIKISLELNKTYKLLTATAAQRRRIYGTYDTASRRVWWALGESQTGKENSVLYGFYLDFGVHPSGTFTTMSNLLNFQPSSIAYKSGVLYLGHGSGVLLKTYDDAKYDATVDTTLAASSWGQSVIPYDWTSMAWDVGTIFKRKYQTKVHIVGKNKGHQAVQIYAIRDLNQTGQGPVPMAPINYQDSCVWGDARFIWGDSNFVWRYGGKMDLWRRFPATTLRSDLMQVQLTPASLTVYSSSGDYPEFANAVTDAAAKTATIQTPAGYTAIVWPKDIVGYTMSFDYDGYATAFTITALDVTGTIATLSDPSSLLLSAPGGAAWQIAGQKKNQRLSITSMVVHYNYLGDKNQAFPGYTTGSGAGNAGNNP